ncbi:MAG: MBL fold metallo-hydrolase [Mariniblastus sp.]
MNIASQNSRSTPGLSASIDAGLDSDMPVAYSFDSVPKIGVPTEVADGIWLIRLPISLAMDHVNVYLLADGDGWTLVDTGCNVDNCREVFLNSLEQFPINQLPIQRVIVTHFHPDHVGMAGYFTGGDTSPHSATLLTSRTTWHSTRLLLADSPAVPHDEHIAFMQLSGMKGIELESFKRRSPSTYAEKVSPLPASYQRLRELDELTIGNRQWKVRLGNGHADEHITLWSDDNIAIVGDQILPAISPNLSVHFSEPAADCVADWMTSCSAFAKIAKGSTLCLPGHNRPFTGAPTRCKQLIDNCQQVLDRIVESLSKPKTAMEVMPDIYRRKLSAYEKHLLLGETIGYLNHLMFAGRVKRKTSSQGCHLWRRPPTLSSQAKETQ